MALSPQFLDQVRERTLLSALIQRSVKLKRAGREWSGCCPFHEEKTASFYVNDDKAFYHCFGCSAHGDAIRWMCDTQGLEFLDAVRELAAAAAIDMPARTLEATQRERDAVDLSDVLARAASWYRDQLDQCGAAREYLAARGIGDAEIHDWQLGWAIGGRSSVRSAVHGASDAMLQDAGLLNRPGDDWKPVDFFFQRIMIPVRDHRGRICGFAGRGMPGVTPKYVNSPDGPIFDKGRILFGLDRAAPLARAQRRLLIVEGQFDALRLLDLGIPAVAPMGTALTEAQIARAWRCCHAPVLVFDGDAAGRAAAVRACERALPGVAPGATLKVAMLPEGEDADSLARRIPDASNPAGTVLGGGAAAIEAAVADARPVDEFLFDTVVARAA